MTIRILRAADHRRKPWKNGRGETVEVAVYPQGAGLHDFGWRVSMAGVVEDGAFSIFSGVDRTLAVLTGNGIELQIKGMASELLTPDSHPLSFPADVACSARLGNGPISDLNIMTRRGLYRHRLDRNTVTSGSDFRLILATGAVTVALGGTAYRLDALDAIYCDGPEASLPLGPIAGVWLIEIDRI
ncbi:HutD/Ves family protein [Paracoccus aestuariivivens]|uniref:HutD family protein n=1 Tax=Paracoccus aestuariivivens TaxID=1820333 RepID=A0A6L6JF52_9RHOB|nr:HutD family protein [Paracoccus aestuariivivens]MTH80186.1 HutD family protein [Paracoccus aestuariivivens]